MSFRNVVITQHAKLSYSAQNLVVQSNEGMNVIPLRDISVILIDTLQAVLTTELIAELTNYKVKVIFINDRHQPTAQLLSCDYYHSYLNHLRTQIDWTKKKKEFLWTAIVLAKISSQIQAVEAMGLNGDNLRYYLNAVELNDTTNREGVVAKQYFPILFNSDTFKRRDPDNQVNAVLNYGYAILVSYLSRSIVSHGYLTQLGIHHISDENLYNLSYDLVEPFRPVVELWVVNQTAIALIPKVKYALVGLMQCHIKYNDKMMTVANAMDSLVMDSLNYLADKTAQITVKVELTNEVSSYEINDNV